MKMSRQAGQYQRRNGQMAGSLSPEAGCSQGGGCNGDLCAEKWGTLFPQLFPSSPSSPCLETLVTSPLAQSLRVKVSPRKREQSWNKTSPSATTSSSLALRSRAPFYGFPRPAAGAVIEPPPSPAALVHPGGSFCVEGRSPAAGVSGVLRPLARSGGFAARSPPARGGAAGGRHASALRPSRSVVCPDAAPQRRWPGPGAGWEQGRNHRYTRAQGGLGKHQPGVSERAGGQELPPLPPQLPARGPAL